MRNLNRKTFEAKMWYYLEYDIQLIQHFLHDQMRLNEEGEQGELGILFHDCKVYQDL